MRTCKESGCINPAHARDMCGMHYERWRIKTPKALRAPGKTAAMPLADRIWKYVQKGPGCWIWTGSMQANGYGNIALSLREDFKGGSGRLLAHRAMYELLKGPIPAGLDLDHICRVRKCVNPEHLEPVTRQVNVLRGQTVTAANAIKTHCIHGHPFDESNTRIKKRPNGKQSRNCKACDARQTAEYKARKRSEKGAHAS